jgi:hypothetical protein
MMIVLVKEVIIITMVGSKATRVVKKINSRVGTLPPFNCVRRSFMVLLPPLL